MVLRTQETIAVESATRRELRGLITARQGGNQGNRYPNLSFFPSSNLPVSAISQTKLETHGKKNCVSGLYNLASQDTEQGGEGWRVGLEGQKVKAQRAHSLLSCKDSLGRWCGHSTS